MPVRGQGKSVYRKSEVRVRDSERQNRPAGRRRALFALVVVVTTLLPSAGSSSWLLSDVTSSTVLFIACVSKLPGPSGFIFPSPSASLDIAVCVLHPALHASGRGRFPERLGCAALENHYIPELACPRPSKRYVCPRSRCESTSLDSHFNSAILRCATSFLDYIRFLLACMSYPDLLLIPLLLRFDRLFISSWHVRRIIICIIGDMGTSG
jgi:hypothetical protein